MMIDQKYDKTLIGVACGVAFGFGCIFVYLYGVNVPYWDQFSYVDLFQRALSGNLRFHDLWTQHNEHRFFVPNIITLFLAYLSNYNTIVEMIFVEFLFLVNLFVVLAIFVRHSELRSSSWLFLPIPFLVFSFRQWQNMLWGFQVSFVLPLTFSLIAILLLSYVDRDAQYWVKCTCLFFVVLFAFASSFSSAMGLMIWPSLLIQVFLFRMKIRRKLLLSLFMLVMTFVAWFLYFHGYRQSSNEHAFSYFLVHPGSFLRYFLTCLGALIPNVVFARSLGGCLLVLSVILPVEFARRRCITDYGTVISIATFSISVVFSVSVGRMLLGDNQALASRYTTYSTYFYIALYIMIIGLILRVVEESGVGQSKRIKKYMAFSIIAIFGLGFPVMYRDGCQNGVRVRRQRTELARILLRYETASDNQLKRLHPDTFRVRRFSKLMRENELSIFHSGKNSRKTGHSSSEKGRINDSSELFGDDFESGGSGSWFF